MTVPGRTPSSWRKRVIAGAFAAAASAVTIAFHSPSVAAPQPDSIRWTVEQIRSSGGSDDIQLTIDSRWGIGNHSVWSDSRHLGELHGLGPAQLQGGAQPVRFALVREAGRLDCSGTAGGGRGSGPCAFTPDAGFSAFLSAHGIGGADRHQSFTLTMSGVGRDLIDALEKSGFDRPTGEQLAAMGVHGVSATYVRGLGARGYRLSADDLIAFKIHGVEPEYVRELADISPGLRQISPSDVVSLKIHGVSAAWVRQMAAIGPGFRNLNADDLVSMAIHDVRPELARSFVELEAGPLRSDDLVSLAIHGVTAQYIRELAALGYRRLTADDLVNMAIHGVSPGYVSSLRRAGMATLSADQLVRLRLSGFEPNAR